MTDTVVAEPEATENVGGHGLSAGLLVHSALFLALLLALWPLADAGTPWTPDEGVYGTQAAALQDGTWGYESPAAHFDPEGIFNRFGSVPYARHPLYPWALSRSFDVAGPGAGIVWASVLGAVLAAAGAWCIGAQLRPGSERWAFWLAAASPLAFNGLVLWAHAPAAAAAAWATVGALRAVSGQRSGPGPWVLAGSASALAVLLRSEGLVFAVALAGAVGLVGLVLRRPRLVGGAVALTAVAGATVYLDGWWRRSVGGGAADQFADRGGGILGDIGFVDGRIEGFRRALLDGGVWSEPTRTIGQLIVVLLVAAIVAVAWRGIDRIVVALCSVTVALYVVRLIIDPVDPLSGLLVAWPVAVVAGLAVVKRFRGDRTSTLLVAATVGAFAVGVVLTQYADGGALQWGGRFFAPAVPLLAALAASALRSPPLARTPAAAACLALSAGLAVQGLVELRLNREQHAEVVAALEAHDADLYVTIVPSLPAVSWRHELPWFQASVDEADDALEAAARAGADDVLLLWAKGIPLATPGWESEIRDELPYDGFELQVVELTRP